MAAVGRRRLVWTGSLYLVGRAGSEVQLHCLFDTWQPFKCAGVGALFMLSYCCAAWAPFCLSVCFLCGARGALARGAGWCTGTASAPPPSFPGCARLPWAQHTFSSKTTLHGALCNRASSTVWAFVRNVPECGPRAPPMAARCGQAHRSFHAGRAFFPLSCHDGRFRRRAELGPC